MLQDPRQRNIGLTSTATKFCNTDSKNSAIKILDENKDSSKKLWKTLNSLIPNDKKSNTTPQFLTEENKEISGNKNIAETWLALTIVIQSFIDN